jgi:cardiolipin synthase
MAILDILMSVLSTVAPYLLAAVTLAAATIAAGHAILYRRDARSTTIWVGLIWLVPLVGALLYVLLGVNRIRRRAKRVRQAGEDHADISAVTRPALETGEYRWFQPHMLSHVRLVNTLADEPLTNGNQVELLDGGELAYPAMQEAIANARSTVAMTSYIFDSDRAGREFLEVLRQAVKRGVEVRVLIDGVGLRYSRPSMLRLLSRAGVPCAAFIRPLAPFRFAYMNMRSHRKILVVDGELGFTGGMNIREGCVPSLDPPPGHPIRDVHARLEGPVVRHLQRTFVEDWAFAHGEQLEGEAWFPALEPAGEVLARGIRAGPDEDLDKLRMTLLSVLGVAQRRVRIITPYFIPDASLITALNLAAGHGAEVDIVLPAINNLSLVQWASTATVWQVLEHGCRIWLTPPPFDHTKLMTVDGIWSLLGSCNWDPRSLRLNFEFNVECYSEQLATEVEAIFEERRARARLLTMEQVDGRSIPMRLRDGVARMFSPYL